MRRLTSKPLGPDGLCLEGTPKKNKEVVIYHYYFFIFFGFISSIHYSPSRRTDNYCCSSSRLLLRSSLMSPHRTATTNNCAKYKPTYGAGAHVRKGANFSLALSVPIYLCTSQRGRAPLDWLLLVPLRRPWRRRRRLSNN